MNLAAQFLIFEVDDRQYGISVDRVERVVRAVDVTPLPRGPSLVLGVIDVHGTLVPVFDVRRRVGSPSKPVGVLDQFVIIRGIRRNVALVVDRVRDIVEIAASALASPEAIWPEWKEIEGAAQLQTGLILVEDVDRFLSLEEDRMLEEALKEHAHHGR
jgi:purine-binding chemotaxis protein CheW